jgi:hypothetical protein
MQVATHQRQCFVQIGDGVGKLRGYCSKNTMISQLNDLAETRCAFSGLERIIRSKSIFAMIAFL